MSVVDLATTTAATATLIASRRSISRVCPWRNYDGCFMSLCRYLSFSSFAVIPAPLSPSSPLASSTSFRGHVRRSINRTAMTTPILSRRDGAAAIDRWRPRNAIARYSRNGPFCGVFQSARRRSVMRGCCANIDYQISLPKRDTRKSTRALPNIA